MRHGKARVELEGAAESLLRARLAVGGRVDVLADDPVAPAEPGPGRSEAWVQLQAALVQIARSHQPLVHAGEVVRSKVERIRIGVVRRVGRGRRHSRQRKRQRVHHAPCDVVLQAEQIAERRLDRVRREQRAARRLDELHRGSQLVAGAQQCSHDDAIDVGIHRQGLEVRRLSGKARGNRARAHDERADARQRRRDGIRQAEGQKVRVGIGTQGTERQHDEPGESLSQGRGVAGVHAPDGAQLLRHGVGRCRPLCRLLGERAADHTVRRGHGRRAGERRRLFVKRGV